MGNNVIPTIIAFEKIHIFQIWRFQLLKKTVISRKEL